MTQIVSYELDYWRQTGTRLGVAPYYRYLTAFGLCAEEFAGKSVVDVGCGYWGGMASVLSSICNAVAVDTLADEYRNMGSKADITKGAAESIPFADASFDAAFMCNALDHCQIPAVACSDICRVLRPAGRLYLHVHLRTKEQLNAGHDLALSEVTVLGWMYDAGFRIARLTIHDRDPVENTPYRTMIGEFIAPMEKP